jgi:excisionase family DNA binding protein
METEQTPERGLDPLLSIDDLADYLGLPVRTIYAWRTEGKGPRGVLLGKHVKFYASDVQAWLAGRRETSPGRGTTEGGER